MAFQCVPSAICAEARDIYLFKPCNRRRSHDDVIKYAQANNVTQIIIGKSARARWFEILHGSVVHDLVRRGRITPHDAAMLLELRRMLAWGRRPWRSKLGAVVWRMVFE